MFVIFSELDEVGPFDGKGSIMQGILSRWLKSRWGRRRIGLLALVEIASKCLGRANQETAEDPIGSLGHHLDEHGIRCGTLEMLRENLCEARRARLPAPSLFDALVFATANHFEAKVSTGDEHVKSLPETLWMG